MWKHLLEYGHIFGVDTNGNRHEVPASARDVIITAASHPRLAQGGAENQEVKSATLLISYQQLAVRKAPRSLISSKPFIQCEA